MIAQPDHTVNVAGRVNVNKSNPTILLASSSPRRRELIKLFGLPVETTSADIDETPLDHESAADMAVRLSQAKAQAVVSSVPHPAPVILLASDTTVSLAGEPLGKPIDAADARSMLTRLRDRVHQVYTAITLIDLQTDRMIGPDRTITDLAASDVRMRDYPDEELDAYIASGDPFDKAGAYAIQHSGFHPAENFAHCFANVMGLPLCHVARSLRKLGIEPLNAVPEACQAYLNYACPVYQSILTSNE